MNWIRGENAYFFFPELNGIFIRVLCTNKCNTRYSPKISAIGNCMINSVLRVYDRTGIQILYYYLLLEDVLNFT